MEQLTFNESGGFFPIQSRQEGYTTEKKQPMRSPWSWAFSARKTCSDLLLDSLQITHYIYYVTLLVGHKTWTLILAAKEDSALRNGKAAAGRHWVCWVFRFGPHQFGSSHKTFFLEILWVGNPSPQEQAVLLLKINIKQWAIQHVV